MGSKLVPGYGGDDFEEPSEQPSDWVIAMMHLIDAYAGAYAASRLMVDRTGKPAYELVTDAREAVYRQLVSHS